jgi:glycerol-3-phosphate acyltransferase PlsX
MQRSLLSRLGYMLARPGFNVLRQKLDPRAVNGGVFLGLNGVVVKSHGGTDGIGFATALELAIEMGESDFTARIADAMAHLPAAFQALGGPAPEAIPDVAPAPVEVAAS